jgi:hypothetical protein
LLRGRIAPVVEAVAVERNAQHLDLRSRRLGFRIGDSPEDLRSDNSREEPEDDDHHEQLDEGEPGV